MYQTDNIADKTGPVPTEEPVPSVQYAFVPEANEQEEEETGSAVQSHISQNVDSESELEMQKSTEIDLQRLM